jgi:hypothetical protein
MARTGLLGVLPPTGDCTTRPNAEHAMIETTTCPDPQCQAPAEVLDHFDLASTDGPIEHIRTRCVLSHIYTVATDRTYAKIGDPYPFSTTLVGLRLGPDA